MTLSKGVVIGVEIQKNDLDSVHLGDGSADQDEKKMLKLLGSVLKNPGQGT